MVKLTFAQRILLNRKNYVPQPYTVIARRDHAVFKFETVF